MQSLREVRESKGVKLNAVADHLGVTRQTYSKYESRPQSMSIDQAFAVCNYLGCSVDSVFLNTDVSLIDSSKVSTDYILGRETAAPEGSGR